MISKTVNYFYEYYLNPRFASRNYMYPTHINFPITDNCNSKCQMCNVWKDKSENELSVDEIKTLFSDRLFKKANHIGISGGEPTLRSDLVECVSVILNAIPSLKSLTITSHGFHPTKWKRLLPEIIGICNSKNVYFKLNISVDGIGELHEEVRRIEGGWEKVEQTIQITKINNCPLQIQCTVSKHNVFGVNEVLHFAKKNNIEVIFRKATSINRLYNSQITDEFFTSNQEDSFFSDFLKSDELLNNTENPGRRLIYNDISNRLVKGTPRIAPCHFQNNGVLISAHGEMFHCSIDVEPLGSCRKEKPYNIYFSDTSKKQLDNLLNEVCPKCIHDQSGSWNPFLLIKDIINSKFDFIKTLGTYFVFGVKNIGFAMGIYSRKVRVDESLKNKKTLHVIGAYGGEHVGDSAILGGVILRQLKRHPDLEEIIVYSKRADRTLFWVKGLDLDTNVCVLVKDYEVLNNVLISSKDILTWAGGPIMEMPVDLFDHYMTIVSFVKKGIDFEIIGCGWGPFKTKYALSIAKMTLNKAVFVQMRDNYELPVEYDLQKDPAFDYLLSQKGRVTSEWNWHKHKIDEFIAKKRSGQNQKMILLNMRPIWAKYNKSDKTSDELDEMVVQKVFDVIKNAPSDLKFVSVPFNTDHYGFSDMLPALELKDLCQKNNIHNYEIFDRELNARDMIYLLSQFNSGICMRFHACIFMKSMNIPVYGIDYTAGEIGKVGGLFKSFNDKNHSNILHLNVKGILEFLSSN